MSKVTIKKKEKKISREYLSDLSAQTLFWIEPDHEKFFLLTGKRSVYEDAYLCIVFVDNAPIDITTVASNRIVTPLYNHNIEAIITEE